MRHKDIQFITFGIPRSQLQALEEQGIPVYAVSLWSPEMEQNRNFPLSSSDVYRG